MSWLDEQAFWIVVGVIVFTLLFIAAFVARNIATKEDKAKRSESETVSSSVSITKGKNTREFD